MNDIVTSYEALLNNYVETLETIKGLRDRFRELQATGPVECSRMEFMGWANTIDEIIEKSMAFRNTDFCQKLVDLVSGHNQYLTDDYNAQISAMQDKT